MRHQDLINFKQYFQEALNYVLDSEFCTAFAKKKFTHSVQVLEIGRQLMAKDTRLQNRNPEFCQLAEQALLFHDVGRFKEIKLMYDENCEKIANSWFSRKHDHGVYSAEIMGDSCDYNDQRIVLPLKHHGHMIEQFYLEPEFQMITNVELKKEIEEILFLVRDADKLANFYIQKHEDNLHREPFYQLMSEDVAKAPLSTEVMEQFFNHRAIQVKTIKSYADRLVCFISWLFDFNYNTSIKICFDEGYIHNLLDVLSQYNHDTEMQEKITHFVNDFFQEKIMSW